MAMFKQGLVTAFIVLAVAFSVFAPVAAVAQECKSVPRAPKNIDIKVENGAPVFANNACPGNPSRPGGDICNARDDRPVMKFKLRGDSSGWSFTGIELSVNGNEFPGPALPAGAYEDFKFASEHDRLLHRPIARVTGGGSIMTVDNDNCFNFDVHYQVILENPEGDEVKLHPVIENRGIGN